TPSAAGSASPSATPAAICSKNSANSTPSPTTWMRSPTCSPAPPCSPPATTSTPAANGGNAVPAKPPPSNPPAPIDPRAYLTDLVTGPEAGDESPLPQIRRIAETPRLAQVFRDLAARGRSAFLNALAGRNLLARELAAGELARLRTELLGDS